MVDPTELYKNLHSSLRPGLAPHPTAKSHREAMQRLRAMSPEELLATSVKAGVHNPDGSLQEAYVSPEHCPMCDELNCSGT